MKIEVNNFDLESTLLSGQCFRVSKNDDGSFDCILNDRIINIKQESNTLIVNSNDTSNLKNIVIDYFDLKNNYQEINKAINVDAIMNNCINKCFGYKILKQDFFEMCISYIISQNNNVKRISNSIELLSNRYGEKIKFNNKEYYLFPKYNDIKDLTIEDLKFLKIGFRDKYIIDFLNKYSILNNIDELNTNDALNLLMSINGIGLKVSSCILLFGKSRYDVYPIDTWVKQFMKSNYNINDNQKEIMKFCQNKFGKYSGIAIQYMFHSNRNKED